MRLKRHCYLALSLIISSIFANTISSSVLAFIVPSSTRRLLISKSIVGAVLLAGKSSTERGYYRGAAAASAMSSSSGGGLADIGKSGSGPQDTSTSTSSAKEDKGGSGAQVPEESKKLPKWRIDLEKSLDVNAKDMHSKFIQLATVRTAEDGSIRPAARWVVFRGFLGGTEVIKFITDSRSEKVAQVAVNDFGEVSWYFVQSREQYRMAGRVRIVTSTETDQTLVTARQEQWVALSDNARSQFFWPHPKDAQAPNQDPSIFHLPPPDPSKDPVPETFCLALFSSESVDHLQLREDPQKRTIHKLVHENEWSRVLSCSSNIADDAAEAEKNSSGSKQSSWSTTAVNP